MAKPFTASNGFSVTEVDGGILVDNLFVGIEYVDALFQYASHIYQEASK